MGGFEVKSSLYSYGLGEVCPSGYQMMKGSRLHQGNHRQAEGGSQWFAGAGDRRKERRPECKAEVSCTAELFLFRMVLCGAAFLLILLLIPMAVIAAAIKLDSSGPVLYRQERVTAYGRHFRIHKFRTMVSDADRIGAAVTVGNDRRITKIGAKLRKVRLDAAVDVDQVYVDQVLPEKMKWNLQSMWEFSLGADFRTLVRTVAAVFGGKD